MKIPNSCDKCSLSENARGIVWGYGNEKADIMLIGEAPGAHEDMSGKPFQGKAGKYLDSILEELGLNRKKVYITNICKCKPDKNNKPTKKQAHACMPHLEREIRSVKPKIIIALGRIAIQALTDDWSLGVNSVRGKEMNYNGIKLYATFHPAIILHKGTYYIKPILEDIGRIIKKADRKTNDKILIEVRSSENLNNLLSGIDSKRVSMDLETDGKDPFNKNSLGILTCSIAWSNRIVVFDWLKLKEKDYHPLPIIHNHLFSGDKRVIGHNLKFDLKWLMREGLSEKKVLDTPIGDTIVMTNVWNIGFPDKSLGFLYKYFTDKADYNELNFKDNSALSYYNDDPESLLIYNAHDADATLRLYNRLLKEIRKENLVNQVKFQFLLTALLAVMEYRGVRVDQKTLSKLEKYFRSLIGKTKKEFKRRSGIIIPDQLNLNSSNQLRRFLYRSYKEKGYKNLGIKDAESSRRTKKNNYLSTSAETLNELVERYPIINLIQDYKFASKTLSTFIKPYKGSDYIHANFNQVKREETDSREKEGTSSFRLSSKDPNLQQLPNPKKTERQSHHAARIKRMFISRFKGGKIITVDYSQGELRMLADVANEETMLRFFREGKDIHRMIASEVYEVAPDKVSEYQRKEIKKVNFGISYMITSYGLSQRINIPIERAQWILTEWFKKFPEVEDYQLKIQREVIKNKRIYNAFGFYKDFPEADPTTIRGKHTIRSAVNFPIQSLLVLLQLFGMVIAEKTLKVEGFKTETISQIHDEGIYDSPEDEADEVVELLYQTYEDLPTKEYFGYEFKVPIKVDIAIGNSLGEVKEIKR